MQIQLDDELYMFRANTVKSDMFLSMFRRPIERETANSHPFPFSILILCPQKERPKVMRI